MSGLVVYFTATIQWLLCLLRAKDHHAAASPVEYIEADLVTDILRSEDSIVGPPTAEHNILKPQNKMMYLGKP